MLPGDGNFMFDGAGFGLHPAVREYREEEYNGTPAGVVFHVRGFPPIRMLFGVLLTFSGN